MWRKFERLKEINVDIIKSLNSTRQRIKLKKRKVKTGDDIGQSLSQPATSSNQKRMQNDSLNKTHEIDVFALRHRLGYSNKAFAELIGVSPATLRKWERGKKKPDPSQVRLLYLLERVPVASFILEEYGY